MGRVHISALGFRFLGFEILLGWGLGLSPIPVINLIFVIYYRNGMSPIAVINHKYEIYYWNGMSSIAVINHKYEIYYQNGGQKIAWVGLAKMAMGWVLAQPIPNQPK